ncbi:hypothetical protein PR202_ga21947 [Eleusine coracana subsp. coracana]|uniref:Uncharacterized protein n=1 Tax=Eleusine coracana subsp. coracana TaxID=191504 RepID=A0AAV5D1R6_ELECO|nr:hypothetical protein PR202_ga21947 [Eleusine coracana subsp. coracana]
MSKGCVEWREQGCGSSSYKGSRGSVGAAPHAHQSPCTLARSRLLARALALLPSSCHRRYASPQCSRPPPLTLRSGGLWRDSAFEEQGTRTRRRMGKGGARNRHLSIASLTAPKSATNFTCLSDLLVQFLECAGSDRWILIVSSIITSPAAATPPSLNCASCFNHPVLVLQPALHAILPSLKVSKVKGGDCSLSGPNGDGVFMVNGDWGLVAGGSPFVHVVEGHDNDEEEFADLEPFFFDEAEAGADHERRTRRKQEEARKLRDLAAKSQMAVKDGLRDYDPKQGRLYYNRFCYADLSTFDLNEEFLEVASRIVKLVRESSSASSGIILSDILLFGNKKRMKIDDDHDLSAVFLSSHFLEKSVEKQHQLYMEKIHEKMNKRQMKNNEKNKIDADKIAIGAEGKGQDKVLHTDCPRNSTMVRSFRCMTEMAELLNILHAFINDEDDDTWFDGVLEEQIYEYNEPLKWSDLLASVHTEKCKKLKFRMARSLCVQQLRYLQTSLELPSWANQFHYFEDDCRRDIRLYLLQRTKCILCTVSSSFCFYKVPMDKDNCLPLGMLIVNEAAQLKECETLIPMQLPGIKQVVLIGDECQLPALVKSKLSENARFGRSVFERLSSLGYCKHLLNVQYRMHPEISKFPVANFYESKISDGPNVVCKNYERSLLPGKMFGPYSFINVDGGHETTERHGRSLKNTVEIAAVLWIVQRLFEGLVFFLFFGRHCLWIVGNATTLSSSRSIWRKIVKDAMDRGCLFDASDNKDLSNALVNAIIELDDSENLAKMDSLHISMPMFQDRTRRREEEVGSFGDVARYYLTRIAKNDGKFALSYLDKLVFSWSVEDVFNRDLFRHENLLFSLFLRLDLDLGAVFFFRNFGGGYRCPPEFSLN